MELWRYACQGRWSVVLGYGLFVAIMAVGYFYNLTFVQLGLVDLGTRVIGLSAGAMAAHVVLFAVATAGVALLAAVVMQRHAWSSDFLIKIRVVFGVVLIQTALTAAAPWIQTEGALLAWIVTCSVAMGIATPSTFALAVDLVPVRARGSAAALITAGSFAPAALLASDWRIDTLARQLLPLMVLGAVSLVPVLWGRLELLRQLSTQHRLSEFSRGWLVSDGPRTGRDRRFAAALLLMFGVYFIDSLGFLRIVATPTLVIHTWQAQDLQTLVLIAGAHVLGAAIAGVLYRPLGLEALFAWIFGIFTILHLFYAVHSLIVPDSYIGFGTSMLYAIAVSMYTTMNFAIWADLSTPRTIALNSALGVVLSAWMATFLSTALALSWSGGELPLRAHFDVLAALSMMLFLAVAGHMLLQGWRRAVPS